MQIAKHRILFFWVNLKSLYLFRGLIDSTNYFVFLFINTLGFLLHETAKLAKIPLVCIESLLRFEFYVLPHLDISEVHLILNLNLNFLLDIFIQTHSHLLIDSLCLPNQISLFFSLDSSIRSLLS